MLTREFFSKYFKSRSSEVNSNKLTGSCFMISEFAEYLVEEIIFKLVKIFDAMTSSV